MSLAGRAHGCLVKDSKKVGAVYGCAGTENPIVELTPVVPTTTFHAYTVGFDTGEVCTSIHTH